MKKTLKACLGLLVLLLCVDGWAQSGSPADKPGRAPSPAALPDYVLRPGDTIAVKILNEPVLNDQNKAIKISQDYTITLAMIDAPVSLKDKTQRQAEKIIHDLYAPDYIKNPYVTVAIAEYVASTVTIYGEVGRPSLVPIPPDRPLTFLDAIAQCGGFTHSARTNKVQLTHAGDTTPQTINADDIKGGKNDFPLMQGDIIFVPEIIF